MKKDFENLKKIFEQANEQLLNLDMDLFESQVSEQTICGALAIRLHDILKDTQYSKYYVDIEYNRNRGGKFKKIYVEKGSWIELFLLCVFFKQDKKAY